MNIGFPGSTMLFRPPRHLITLHTPTLDLLARVDVSLGQYNVVPARALVDCFLADDEEAAVGFARRLAVQWLGPAGAETKERSGVRRKFQSFGSVLLQVAAGVAGWLSSISSSRTTEPQSTKLRYFPKAPSLLHNSTPKHYINI